MSLASLYESASHSVVGFISKLQAVPLGLVTIFPQSFGTGFFVTADGVVATNRHVVKLLDSLPANPVTGESLASRARAIAINLIDEEAHQERICVREVTENRFEQGVQCEEINHAWEPSHVFSTDAADVMGYSDLHKEEGQWNYRISQKNWEGCEVLLRHYKRRTPGPSLAWISSKTPLASCPCSSPLS